MDPLGLAIILAGAALGAAAGFVLTLPLDATPVMRVLRLGFVLLCAATGAVGTLRVYTSLDASAVRTPIPGLAAPAGDPLAAALAEAPFLARVFRDFPAREVALRERLRAAEAAGGAAARELALLEGLTEIGLFARAQYLPRAKGPDLIRFTVELVNMIRDLAEADPQLCFRFISAGGAEGPVSTDAIAGRIGRARVAAFESAAAQAIEKAALELPAYDRAEARVLMLKVGQEMVVKHGIAGVALLSGDKPVKTDAEAMRACRVAADMYDAILRRPEAEAAGALRHLLVGETAPAAGQADQ